MCQYISSTNAFQVTTLSSINTFQVSLLHKCRHFPVSIFACINTSSKLSTFKVLILFSHRHILSIITFQVSILLKYQRHQYFANIKNIRTSQVSKLSILFEYRTHQYVLGIDTFKYPYYFSSVNTFQLLLLFK